MHSFSLQEGKRRLHQASPQQENVRYKQLWSLTLSAREVTLGDKTISSALIPLLWMTRLVIAALGPQKLVRKDREVHRGGKALPLPSGYPLGAPWPSRTKG